MNSLSTVGLITFQLFAYYKPIQPGETYKLLDAFVGGQEYITDEDRRVCIELHRIRSDNYEIRETTVSWANHVDLFIRSIFAINAFHTMLRNIVVVVTEDKQPIQMRFADEKEARKVFDTSVRRTLHERLFSYDVAAVYKYGEGRILADVDLVFSGFTDITPLFPMNRNIIHSGDVNALTKRQVLIHRLIPHLLWTEKSFNFNVDRLKKSVVFTLPRPGQSAYDYYLVQFAHSKDFEEWYNFYGLILYTDDVPEPTGNIILYFREFV